MIDNNRADAMANANNEPFSLPSHYAEQKYWCRNKMCNKIAFSLGIPDNWYIVKLSRGEHEKLITISIICSLNCLAMDVVHELTRR